jgi:hypothetical protein
MSISYKFIKFEVKEIKKEVKENNISFWAQPTSKFEFHSTEAQKIKEEKNGGKFRFKQKQLRHQNGYRNLIN